MNRLQQKLQENKKLLSIYFTAGYPQLEDTVPIIQSLEESGVDFIEIGLPFSDPLADGPTIQKSSTKALKNGMTTSLLFQQLEGIRDHVNIPLVLMGYFNPILQFGVASFCKQCKAVGIDGLILPDLPLQEYRKNYQSLFEKYSLPVIFLITPQTTEGRIREIDQSSTSFIYMVSSASTTGSQGAFGGIQQNYFKRIADMNLKHPQIVGFGIHDKKTFTVATTFAKGAIVGSAFINMLEKDGMGGISTFIKNIRF
ncbi:MAG: tryptophan synthase subunit alpha [Flavobacteriaceae bacterium]